jgi:type I restriction enzyme S subunit
MVGEWKSERFDRMAHLVRDGVQPYDARGLPYIALEHIGEGTLALTGLGVAEDAASTKSRFARGDILFGKLRPYFRKVVRAPCDGICSTDIWVVRPQSGVDSGFLFYLMASELFIEPVVRASEGTKMPRAKWEYAASLDLPLPPLPEQRAIAHILGTLDDKIELNRRMSETLEAMARAIFKSWFVDFDPVRAKAAVRREHPKWTDEQVSRAACPELKPEIAALFPDSFQDSELGEIPKGWEIGTFGDVVEQLRDNENPLESRDVVFQHFSIPAFDDGQWPKAELGVSIKSQKSRVPPGAVLLSKLNPEIERVWLVDVRPGDRSVCSTEFLVLAPRPPHGRSFAYCLARSSGLRQELKGLVTGTSKSHQRAQVSSILGLTAIRPPEPPSALFERLAGPLLARTLECRRESRILAALRDALLPKLISGELRVKDAERFVASVGV